MRNHTEIKDFLQLWSQSLRYQKTQKSWLQTRKSCRNSQFLYQNHALHLPKRVWGRFELTKQNKAKWIYIHREIMGDREAGHAAAHRVPKSQRWRSNWTTEITKTDTQRHTYNFFPTKTHPQSRVKGKDEVMDIQCIERQLGQRLSAQKCTTNY